MRNVKTGACLAWLDHRGDSVLKTGDGTVAMLSRSAGARFREYRDKIEEIRVLGVYKWRKEDGGPEHRDGCVADQWGVPLCEAVLRA